MTGGALPAALLFGLLGVAAPAARAAQPPEPVIEVCIGPDLVLVGIDGIRIAVLGRGECRPSPRPTPPPPAPAPP
ncbi:MAG TPA: hypothetical protein VF069_21825, partial [Streptosporangiaceae bacterium]